MRDEEFKITFDFESKEFSLDYKFLHHRRCYLYDNLKDEVAADNLSIYDGMVRLRELSAFFPDRFHLVLLIDSFSEDIPF